MRSRTANEVTSFPPITQTHADENDSSGSATRLPVHLSLHGGAGGGWEGPESAPVESENKAEVKCRLRRAVIKWWKYDTEACAFNDSYETDIDFDIAVHFITSF